jgi:hypothetical protein
MTKILIAAPIRQTPEIFELYCRSLSMLETPKDCQVDKYFVFHNCNHHIISDNINAEYDVASDETIYEYNKSIDSHGWTVGTLDRLVEIKQDIVKYAKSKQYDYIFWADSDLIIHPHTLVQLYEAKKDIISEIFWTRWTESEMGKTPNCWDFDHYNFAGIESLNKLKCPGSYKVGGTGALTLVKTSIYSRNVNYRPVTNVSFWGEDRAFSIRANVAGYSMWIDTHYPAHHVYRDTDVGRAKLFIKGYGG